MPRGDLLVPRRAHAAPVRGGEILDGQGSLKPMSATIAARLAADCRICGSPLPPAAAAGRPAVFCSEVCRRESEFAIRRLVRRLGKVGDLESDERVEMALSPTEYHAARLEALEAEAARLEARLRELLA